MHLARIKINGHATDPSGISILYNGIARAMFPCPGGGQKVYDVDWKVGIQLPATWCVTLVATKTGGTTTLAPVSWELTFDTHGYGAPLDHFRAVAGACAVADTGTVFSITYEEFELAQGAIPLLAIAMQTGGVAGANSQWKWPAVGALVSQTEASTQVYHNDLEDAPPLPPALNVTFTPTVVGAATTSLIVVYY